MAENTSQDDTPPSLPLSQGAYTRLLELDGSLNNIINDFMAETTTSEMSLPLSQEKFKCLLGLDGSIHNIINDTNDFEITDERSEAFSSMVNEIDVKTGIHNGEGRSSGIFNPYNFLSGNLERMKPVSSLPASESWAGDFAFSVTFNPQKTAKGVNWIYSKERKKLYVGKNVPCPINFSTSVTMPDDVCIRAMPMFSSSDNASENVTRCINHAMEDIKKNLYEAEHLIRCESQYAVYEKDPKTDRHSVVVPFENPPVGQRHSTYMYKFMCFGSCSGGPNRRAMMIIFSLERRGEVLGRQTIDLKVCACPVRDFKGDEKQSQGIHADMKENKPVKRSTELLCKPAKLMKTEDDLTKDNEYCLKTKDKNCYNFLKKMKQLYSIHSALNSTHSSYLKKLIYTSSQSSSSENEN